MQDSLAMIPPALVSARTAVRASTPTFLLKAANHVKLGSIASEERIIAKIVRQAQMDKRRLQAVLLAILGRYQV